LQVDDLPRAYRVKSAGALEKEITLLASNARVDHAIARKEDNGGGCEGALAWVSISIGPARHAVLPVGCRAG